MLAKIVGSVRTWRHSVVSLTGSGPLAGPMEEGGASIHSLDLKSLRGIAGAGGRLPWLIRKLQPDLIQGWMAHGNLAASYAQIFSPSAPLVWNVRQSLGDLRYMKPATRKILKLCAAFSQRPAAIIYNSQAGAEQHETLGFPASRRRIIANGFDTSQFSSDPAQRAETRRALGIAPDDIVIGLIARFHPMKNHIGFLDAAARILQRYPQARFLLAGPGVSDLNPEFQSLLGNSRVRDRSLFLGERADMPKLTGALDIACNVSVHGEGFPNAIGEAMACEVPCIVTPQGDSVRIVGDAGAVCADGDDCTIAAAVCGMIAAGPAKMAAMGALGRKRVIDHYSIESIAAQYEGAYSDIVAHHRFGAPIRPSS